MFCGQEANNLIKEAKANKKNSFFDATSFLFIPYNILFLWLSSCISPVFFVSSLTDINCMAFIQIIRKCEKYT